MLDGRPLELKDDGDLMGLIRKVFAPGERRDSLHF